MEGLCSFLHGSFRQFTDNEKHMVFIVFPSLDRKEAVNLVAAYNHWKQARKIAMVAGGSGEQEPYIYFEIEPLLLPKKTFTTSKHDLYYFQK